MLANPCILYDLHAFSFLGRDEHQSEINLFHPHNPQGGEVMLAIPYIHHNPDASYLGRDEQ
ncbi:hypothetical protein E2C01_011031 [Portunus trituberculatus]|uniref:Uncharacterized protein n=1 Tax=Portunus trituberculatus TaxID=210409 RepID=A0A5B7DAF8_PORTR|nr:hypothetical protein [Portunus trituberculatus]